jgi:hypothetical protein
MLSMIRPRFEVEKRSVRKKIFGIGVSPGEPESSNAKQIMVGCVILTRPFRKSVSHAVAMDTASASAEIPIEYGSAI